MLLLGAVDAATGTTADGTVAATAWAPLFEEAGGAVAGGVGIAG